MNEQQLQQILTIQQAIAAAATAAVINSLLNPQQQQAAGLNNANALTDSSNDLQQHQQAQQELRQSPNNTSSPTTPTPTSTAAAVAALAANSLDSNSRIQDFLLQLQQQAAVSGAAGGASPLNLNLSTSQAALSCLGSSPILSRSPINHSHNNNRLNTNIAQELNATTSNTTTTSTNLHQQQSNSISPIKKLKRHHHHHQQQQQQQLFHNRSCEATSKPQHSTPKNHSTITNLSRNSNQGSNTTSSSSPSAFISNNVGLPRKLVRGQDVWLGRGAEQTRQILKCMWCGQSFRTLAEMTQHMKITQHYTNIISQEQITSWRQPESSDSVSGKHGKQSTQLRSLEDNHDDSSDKFNDSDRDDNFSNDDDLEQQSKHPPSSQQLSRLELQHNKNNDSIDNNSITGSNHGESPSTSLKNLASSKPITRSRKRENESMPIKRDPVGKVNSPTTSSSSQQRQNSGSSSSGSVNLILNDLNEESETNKSPVESKINGNPQKSPEKLAKVTASREEEEEEAEREEKEITEPEEVEGREDDVDNEEKEQDLDGEDDNLKRDENLKPNEDSSVRPENKKLKDMTNEEDDTIGDKDRHEAENVEGDDNDDDDDDDDEGRSETNESADTTTSNAKSRVVQKGEAGDPLSALETMVEKSFDPRLRPGVANGGILQRLGIDEEVCPPWQHINYANWYAAAAYGHPMAAALLAAGINLQNGIKLSKNVDSKKNED